MMCKTGDNAAVESLQHLLTASRKEIEEQRVLTNQANRDLTKLHERINELQVCSCVVKSFHFKKINNNCGFVINRRKSKKSTLTLYETKH